MRVSSQHRQAAWGTLAGQPRVYREALGQGKTLSQKEENAAEPEGDS